MTHNSLLGAANQVGQGFGNAGTNYVPICNSVNAASATEANFQSPVKAGTLSFFRVYLSATGASGTFTATSRLNAGAGAQSISATGGGASGEFEDSTHSDSVIDGDLVNCRFVTTVSGSNFTFVCVSFLYDATSAVTSVYGAYQQTLVESAVSASAFTRGIGCTSNNVLQSVEANAQVKLRSAGTVSNLRVNVSVNTGTNPTTTIATRINGSTGAQSVSFTGGTTGVLSDAVNTDSVAATDLYCYISSSGGTSRSVTYLLMLTDFVSSTSKYDTNHGYSSNGGTSNGSTSTLYLILFGRSSSVAEANAQARFRFGTTFSFLRLNISANTAGNTVTSTYRNGGVAGNSTVSSGSGTSGRFEDATNTDTISSGDLIALTSIGSTTGTYTLMNVASTIGGVNIYSDSVSEALSLSDDASAVVRFAGSTSEALSLAESQDAQLNDIGSGGEALGLSDTNTATCIFNVSVSESLGLTDSSAGTKIAEDSHNIVVIWHSQIG